MEDLANAFLAQAQTYLLKNYMGRIVRCLERLDDVAVWWRPNEQANSIANLMMHLQGNVRQWIISGLGGAPDMRERQREFDERAGAGKAELLSSLEATVEEACGVIEAIAPAELLKPRRIQGLEVTTFGAVFTVVEHFAMHTGQIIWITKALSGQDLRFYDMSSGVPRKSW